MKSKLFTMTYILQACAMAAKCQKFMDLDVDLEQKIKARGLWNAFQQHNVHDHGHKWVPYD